MDGETVAATGDAPITPFIVAMNVVAFFAFVAGWLKGSHPERFGIAVMLFHAVADEFYRDWRLDRDVTYALWIAVPEEQAVGRVVLTLALGWLAFRSMRWWPLAATAVLVLIVLVHALTMVTSISYNAAASARIGLWLILYLILLIGVAERWLTGEAPVSPIGCGTGRRERSAFRLT